MYHRLRLSICNHSRHTITNLMYAIHRLSVLLDVPKLPQQRMIWLVLTSGLRFILAAIIVCENEMEGVNLRLIISAAEGFFNAYGNTVRKDSVDYVVHLGDYIYEYKPESEIGRNALPDRETYSL